MQADCKKPSGIYFGVEQEKNCANKGRKSQDFSSVSGDFITVCQHVTFNLDNPRSSCYLSWMNKRVCTR